MSLQNTHTYDGQLKGFKALIQKQCEEWSDQGESLPSHEQSIQEAYQLLADYKTHSDLVSRARLALGLLEKTNIDNKDTRNEIEVKDIFPGIWHIIKTAPSRLQNQVEVDRIHLLFIEQLADIIGASCSQGRVTRLLQLYSLCLK